MDLQLDPIKFVERNFDINGHPFILIDETPENARHYLGGIYTDFCLKMPKDKKPRVYVKGRQVEFSTTMANFIAYFTESYPHFKTLYVVPAVEQLKRFSGERFQPLLRYKRDPNILNPLGKSGSVEGTFTIKMKQFSNGSTVYLEATGDDGNNIRNIGAELLIKDEYQDIPEEAEGAIDSVLDHSVYNGNASLGTPKYTESQYEKKWKNSSQHYYVLKCPVCHHNFVLHLENLVEGFIIECPQCANREDKRLMMPDGEWVPMGRKDATFVGYHLSQLYVPYKTKERVDQAIAEKRDMGLNVEKFRKNEILGEFYEGISQKPPQEGIERAFKPGLPYNIFIPATKRTYAGIDWGGWSIIDDDPTQALSVYVSGVLYEQGTLYVNYVEILEDQDETKKAERVVQLMKEQRVHLAIGDSGYGKQQCMHIMAAMPRRFLKCKYLPGASTTFLDVKSEQTKRIIKANRDLTLEDLYSAMQSDKIHIPRNQHTEWIIEHFMNHRVRLEERGEHTHKHFYKIPGNKYKVDAVHAMNFFRLAALHDTDGFKHSALVLEDTKLLQQHRTHPMLTGHTVEDIQAMGSMKQRTQMLARSISRTMGE